MTSSHTLRYQSVLFLKLHHIFWESMVCQIIPPNMKNFYVPPWKVSENVETINSNLYGCTQKSNPFLYSPSLEKLAQSHYALFRSNLKNLEQVKFLNYSS